MLKTILPRSLSCVTSLSRQHAVASSVALATLLPRACAARARRRWCPPRSLLAQVPIQARGVPTRAALLRAPRRHMARRTRIWSVRFWLNSLMEAPPIPALWLVRPIHALSAGLSRSRAPTASRAPFLMSPSRHQSLHPTRGRILAHSAQYYLLERLSCRRSRCCALRYQQQPQRSLVGRLTTAATLIRHP